MKFLITGGSGQLGYDIKEELLKRGYKEVYAPSHEELDLTNERQVQDFIVSNRPDVVFHCAAYTAVDKAEEEKEICYDVNVNGTKYLVQGVSQVGAKIIYISTDYVFDGSKDGMYEVDDETSPINYYGYTKCLGEELVRGYPNHFIARISWVFGSNGKNFVKTMLKLAGTKKEISVVSDQVGSPTYTKDLASRLVDISLGYSYGTYHITNEGYCSWYEFAQYIFEVNGIDVKVDPILTKDYKTLARRPLNSKLSKNKLDEKGIERLPGWKDAIERYSKELKKEGEN